MVPSDNKPLPESILTQISVARHMTSLGHTKLTPWGREKMDATSQTTFSSAFSWMKMYELQLKWHSSLFPRVQLTIFQNWFRWWLGADQATSHYLNQWWLDYRRIYAPLGLNELTSYLGKSYSSMISISVVHNPQFLQNIFRISILIKWIIPYVLYR